MKNIFLILFFFLIGCSVKTEIEKIDLENIKVQGAVKNERDIYITFINDGNVSIEIKKTCMFNTYINVCKNGKELMSKIRVKSSPECMFPLLKLNAHNFIESRYDYKIDELFDLEHGIEYEMTIEYYMYANNKLQQKLVSDKYSFVW